MTPIDSFLRLAYRPGIVNYLTPLQGSFSSSNPKFSAIASAIVNTWSGNFKVAPKPIETLIDGNLNEFILGASKLEPRNRDVEQKSWSLTEFANSVSFIPLIILQGWLKALQHLQKTAAHPSHHIVPVLFNLAVK
ncbi:hypothetical protein V2G26_021187 [Clonostachys chloroleuca]